MNAIIDDLMKLSLIEQKTDKKEILLENSPLLPILNSARQVCQPMADEMRYKYSHPSQFIFEILIIF